MSLTIALKHNGVVYMGSDSNVSDLFRKYDLTNPNNYRIFPLKGCDHILMSIDGSLIEQNISRCTSLIPEANAMKGNIDFEFMVNEFVPNLFDIYDQRHILKIKENHYRSCESQMIVAYKDKIFQIFPDGAVLELDDFAVIGDGIDEAIGSLLSTQNIDDPKQRILLALRTCLKYKTEISYPFLITDTDSCQFELFNE